MGDSVLAEVALQELADLGVRLAIDDFGTGFSSLAHLHRLPLHAVKLDRTFTAGLLADGDEALVVTSLVQLVHGLGREVILEGIEDAEHLEAAAEAGADWVQGFHVGRPVEADVLPALLRHRHVIPRPPRLHSVASEYGA
jgi:EAL domain-containing protein (putative c-di-GMP-specific phosphodiesterase class I)